MNEHTILLEVLEKVSQGLQGTAALSARVDGLADSLKRIEAAGNARADEHAALVARVSLLEVGEAWRAADRDLVSRFEKRPPDPLREVESAAKVKLYAKLTTMVAGISALVGASAAGVAKLFAFASG